MKFGAKLLPIGSPLVSTKRPTEKIDPAAASTPSTFRTRSIRRAGKPGGPTSSDWISCRAVIATSVPFSDSLKMSLNDALIVSVRT